MFIILPFLLSLVLVFAFTPSGAARRGKRRTAAPALPGRSVSGMCSFALLHSFCDCLRPDPPCLICPVLSGSAEAASAVVIASHLRPPSTIRTTAQRGNRARRMNREREAVRRCAAFRVSRRGDFMLRPLPQRSRPLQPQTARMSSCCDLLSGVALVFDRVPRTRTNRADHYTLLNLFTLRVVVFAHLL